jgi:hypothetical protein
MYEASLFMYPLTCCCSFHLVSHNRVYVSNIPAELRSNDKLEEFFGHCFSGNPVVDVKVRVIANKLSDLVTKRAQTVIALENALAIKESSGSSPTRTTGSIGNIPGVGTAVAAIPMVGNAIVGERLDAIEGKLTLLLRQLDF